MLGTTEGFAEMHACGMPIEQQCQRLEDELRGRGATGFTVTSPGLYELTGADKDAALDGVVAGEAGPYVLVRGRLVCAGAIDPDAVFAAVQSARADITVR